MAYSELRKGGTLLFMTPDDKEDAVSSLASGAFPAQNKTGKWTAKAIQFGEKVGRAAGDVADVVAEQEAHLENRFRQFAHMPTVEPQESIGSFRVLACVSGLGSAFYLISVVLGQKDKGSKGA
eukprot:gnl/MRDRNA2_/MRDRNA2_22944_c0_seq1.p1 gnl/MRDRNA2_/MRDRNA2_22944_c0~~gnl/MRDRNA2_/MRDRNA2_22944_c0_seq1.p1  ORF type:complete len:142 (+),score=28.50 gnl/MRDRNA2_/MRDRNA2_22944_c0_seq1:60-428(+)